MVSHTAPQGLGDRADSRAPATPGGLHPAGAELSASPGWMPGRLARVAGVCLGACAASLVLLVLGSTPAEAAPQSPMGSDPGLPDLLQPAQNLLGDGLGPLGNVDLSTDVPSLEQPGRGVHALNGSGPLEGSTRVVGNTVGTAEGVLGATAGAPHTLWEIAGSATRVGEATEAALSSTVASATEPLGAGVEPSEPEHELTPSDGPPHSLAGTGTVPSGLFAPEGQLVPRAETPWLRPAYNFGAPPTPATDPGSAANSPYGPAARLPHAPRAKPSTQVGASADNVGGTHLLAGTVPMDETPTPLARFFLANQPRRHLRSPVFPPLVPPG